MPAEADYFHITTNKTSYGTELKEDLDVNVPMEMCIRDRGWAESKRMGLGNVAAISAHCPAESLAAVVSVSYTHLMCIRDRCLVPAGCEW